MPWKASRTSLAWTIISKRTYFIKSSNQRSANIICSIACNILGKQNKSKGNYFSFWAWENWSCLDSWVATSTFAVFFMGSNLKAPGVRVKVISGDWSNYDNGWDTEIKNYTQDNCVLSLDCFDVEGGTFNPRVKASSPLRVVFFQL